MKPSEAGPIALAYVCGKSMEGGWKLCTGKQWIVSVFLRASKAERPIEYMWISRIMGVREHARLQPEVFTKQVVMGTQRPNSLAYPYQLDRYSFTGGWQDTVSSCCGGTSSA